MNNEQLLSYMICRIVEAVDNHQDDLSEEEIVAFMKGWKEATMALVEALNMSPAALADYLKTGVRRKYAPWSTSFPDSKEYWARKKGK